MWAETHKYMVSAGLLKPDVDVRRAYTLQFVKDVRVMP
jgi:NitT/TauT family transport system substrate-binding protein